MESFAEIDLAAKPITTFTVTRASTPVKSALAIVYCSIGWLWFG
jgi:hypothetical protein